MTVRKGQVSCLELLLHHAILSLSSQRPCSPLISMLPGCRATHPSPTRCFQLSQGARRSKCKSPFPEEPHILVSMYTEVFDVLYSPYHVTSLVL